MPDLISLYQQRLNLQNATFLRIDHDDAIIAIVYKVTQPDGAPLILKICPRRQDFLREVYFLKLFAGRLPVPRIIQTLQPKTDIDGAILMECLPGKTLKIADLSDELAYEIGAVFARIHLNRVAGYGDLTDPDDLCPDPRVYLTLKFEEAFAECSHHLPRALLAQCRNYFDSHLHLLSSVDGPCIIHRDFRPGNLIAHQGKLQGVIDWASGRASFAEEDFCSMEHGEWSTNPRSKKSFLAGYAGIRPVPDYQSMMPFMRMNRALNVIGYTVKSGTWETSNARMYQFNRQYLEAFS